MDNQSPQPYQTVANYDRQRWELDGVALFTKPTTIKVLSDKGVRADTFTVETAKMPHGYYVFVDISEGDGLTRVVLPPRVVQAITRHCESLEKRNRSLRGKRIMKARMAAGENPAVHLIAFRKRKARKAKKEPEMKQA